MISIKPKKETSANYFEALKVLGLEPSNAGELLIDLLASERANSFDWKHLKTNSNKLNEYMKKYYWFKEDLYDLSKLSLLKESVGLIIIDNFIEPCNINAIWMRSSDKKIFKAIITVAQISFKDSDWYVQYTYDINKEYVECSLDPIGAFDSKITQQEFDAELEARNLINYWNPKRQGIPLIIWNSFPKNTNFYDLAIEKAKHLSIVNNVIVDQILNLMQKRQLFNSDMETGNPDTHLKEAEKNFFDLTNNVDSMTAEDWTKQVALFSPNSAILKEFRDTADWLEEDIRKHGKAIKDDDNDSAQKNNAELLNINRSATDALELNKDQYENNLKLLIKWFDKELVDDIEVELPFRTINKVMIDNAEQIMIKDKGGSNE